jgi:hypothetical protein
MDFPASKEEKIFNHWKDKSQTYLNKNYELVENSQLWTITV